VRRNASRKHALTSIRGQSTAKEFAVVPLSRCRDLIYFITAYRFIAVSHFDLSLLRIVDHRRLTDYDDFLDLEDP
jgi:uncharacterized protein YfbU (UPF0304 family)